MAVQRLGHVALRVEAIGPFAATAFYQALGLQVTWESRRLDYPPIPGSGDGVALLRQTYTAAGPIFAFTSQTALRSG